MGSEGSVGLKRDARRSDAGCGVRLKKLLERCLAREKPGGGEREVPLYWLNAHEPTASQFALATPSRSVARRHLYAPRAGCDDWLSPVRIAPVAEGRPCRSRKSRREVVVMGSQRNPMRFANADLNGGVGRRGRTMRVVPLRARKHLDHTHSAHSNSACASTVLTASSCKSGG